MGFESVTVSLTVLVTATGGYVWLIWFWPLASVVMSPKSQMYAYAPTGEVVEDAIASMQPAGL